jgi:hypothetical protein
MNLASAEFDALVSSILARFFGQRGVPSPPAAELRRFAAQLRLVVAEQGLPRPLGPDELGRPGGIAEEACASLVSRVIEGTSAPLFADIARQLVKACLYPEFKVCRDSFREVASNGSCRRQELERARKRVSGAHCVDCPHWVGLGPTEHQEFLAREWRGDPALFAAHQAIFLPEDFRALRCWLHAAAREGDSSARGGNAR